jgi:hypothetical protein
MSTTSFITHGNFGGRLLEQPDWSTSDNGRGLLEGTAIFKVNHGGSPATTALPVARLDKHPTDERLVCWDVDATYGRNGIATVTGKYVGIKNGSMTDPEWSISSSASEQSVMFHPKFNQFVAEAAGDKFKIRTDDAGFFVSFGVRHPKVPAVEKFSAPSGSIKISYYTTETDKWFPYSFAGLGKWCKKPPFVPDYLDASVANLSWLLTGSSVLEYANIFKVDLDFTLSVLAKPHNVHLYDELST